MTNAELIAKIKAEIERRLKDYWEISFHDTNSYNKDTNVKELKELLSFISTLESENPVLNDLEEAAVDIADVLLAKPKEYALSAKADYWNGAYDGIIAGAKWQEKQNLRFVKQVLSGDFTVFEAGRKYERKQMMKEAVEGKIIFLLNGDVAVNIGDTDEYKLGQKVRVIICKKEGEK